MSDLISRQAAINACIKVREHHAYDEIEEIKALPSVDAEPVKHGRWVYPPIESMRAYQCSECNKRTDEWSNYCPNCGAKMDL